MLLRRRQHTMPPPPAAELPAAPPRRLQPRRTASKHYRQPSRRCHLPAADADAAFRSDEPTARRAEALAHDATPP